MADAATIEALEQRVPRAAAGDERALAEILALIQPLVHRYCALRLDWRSGVEDVAQETCLAVVRAIPNYRNQGKSFLAFVYGIAGHKVIDARRFAARNPVRPVVQIPDAISTETGPEERMLDRESDRATRELLETLSPRHRQVLVMRVVLGMSTADTAEALNTSQGVVRVMQHRALNRLRSNLTERAG